MENIQKFYENTENALPHPIVKKFIGMNILPGKAIDLGCGAGRDTIFLIKNGWYVVAIDRENINDVVLSKLDKNELDKFSFQCQNFENIKLEKNNLIVANYSIPFCNKNHFKEFWQEITESICDGRILCGKFFWIK